MYDYQSVATAGITLLCIASAMLTPTTRDFFIVVGCMVVTQVVVLQALGIMGAVGEDPKFCCLLDSLTGYLRLLVDNAGQSCYSWMGRSIEGIGQIASFVFKNESTDIAIAVGRYVRVVGVAYFPGFDPTLHNTLVAQLGRVVGTYAAVLLICYPVHLLARVFRKQPK